MELFYLIIVGACLGAVTAKIASVRGVPGPPLSWFIAGALLAIVALPAAILYKPDPKLAERKALAGGESKKCPRCAEMVKTEAQICRFCQHSFTISDVHSAEPVPKPVAPRRFHPRHPEPSWRRLWR